MRSADIRNDGQTGDQVKREKRKKSEIIKIEEKQVRGKM